MLDYINPKAGRPDQVAILTRIGCPFCTRAKRMLTEAGYEYVEVPLPHTIRTKALGAIAKARMDGATLPDGTRMENSREYWLGLAAAYRPNRGGAIPRTGG